MLGSSEDNTALSRALSQLAEVEEKIEQLHQEQANSDFFLLAELLSDYIRLLAVVRVSLFAGSSLPSSGLGLPCPGSSLAREVTSHQPFFHCKEKAPWEPASPSDTLKHVATHSQLPGCSGRSSHA